MMNYWFINNSNKRLSDFFVNGNILLPKPAAKIIALFGTDFISNPN